MVNPQSPFRIRANELNIKPQFTQNSSENQDIQNQEELSLNQQNNHEIKESPFRKSLEEKKEKEEETKLESFVRQAKRSGLRIGETAAGFPGNVVGVVKWLADSLPQPPEALQRKPNVIQTVGRNLLEKLPKSSELKETSNELFPKTSLPQNEWEENADETIETITNMFMPGSGYMRLSTRLGAPVLAQAGKFLTKELGGSETAQEVAKNVLLMGTAIANQPGARATAQQAMRNSERLVNPGDGFDTRRLENALQMIESEPWMRTSTGAGITPSPSASPVIRMINAIRGRIQNGHMNVEDAIQLRKDINEAARNLGAFEIESPGDKITAIQRLGRLRNDFVEHGIGEYGRNQNPAFWAQNQAANSAFAATERGGAIANYIMNNYQKPFVSDTAKILFGHALASGTGNVAKIVGAAAMLSGINASTRVMYRISQSPLLRRHYENVLLHASRNNAPAMAKSLEILDKKLKKEEAKDILKKPQ